MPNLVIPVPGESGEDPNKETVTMDQNAMSLFREELFSDLGAQRKGHQFILESLRTAHVDGKIGSRESLSHRIVSESGSGQSRSQQAAGQGGTPT